MIYDHFKYFFNIAFTLIYLNMKIVYKNNILNIKIKPIIYI
jgi:hypothetical protein